MELIAHRGNNNHQYAENTLEAIMDSINKNYVAGIEIDIRMTKDNKIVVIHDCLINNVSDGMGLVKDFTLSQLQVYNFGTVTHPSKITTLESVLANISNGKKILIEIKEETDHFENLIVSLMTVLDKYPNRNIILCSFNYNLCKFVKKNYCYKIGLIIGVKLNADKFYNNLSFNSINYRHLSKVVFKFKKNYVWTVDDIKLFNKLKKNILKYNVGVITDCAYLFSDEC